MRQIESRLKKLVDLVDLCTLVKKRFRLIYIKNGRRQVVTEQEVDVPISKAATFDPELIVRFVKPQDIKQ